MKNTLEPRSYWNSDGQYQTQLDTLYAIHVPLSGRAKTVHGELIRAVSRLFYEFCNNGNCNALNQKWGEEWTDCRYCYGTGVVDDGEEECECGDCGGDGGWGEDIIEEESISEMFDEFLELIERFVPNSEEAVKNVRNVIMIDYGGDIKHQFSDKNMNIYNHLTDIVMYYIITEPKLDQPLPDWYKNQ